MPTWIVAVQWASRGVLGLLVVLSVWSIATMIRCRRLLSLAQTRDSDSPARDWIAKRQWDELRNWAAKSSTLIAGTARTIMELTPATPAQIDRAVRSYLSLQKTRLEEGLTILATLGSNAPFIGLFGTVLGVIQAFGALGAHQSNSADIMVGISEALVATAVGLFVAIPAVVAFNKFSRTLKVLLVEAEALKDHYLSRSEAQG